MRINEPARGTRRRGSSQIWASRGVCDGRLSGRRPTGFLHASSQAGHLRRQPGRLWGAPRPTSRSVGPDAAEAAFAGKFLELLLLDPDMPTPEHLACFIVVALLEIWLRHSVNKSIDEPSCRRV